MSTLVTQELVNWLASAFIAILAGYVGFRFGLAKHVQEQSLERRLRWYDETVRRLFRVMTLNRELINDIRTENDDYILSESERLVEETLTLLDALSAAELYASKSSCEAAIRLRVSLQEEGQPELTRRWKELKPSGRQPTRDEIYSVTRDLAQQHLSLAETAKSKLVADMRKELRLEKLDEKTRHAAEARVTRQS